MHVFSGNTDTIGDSVDFEIDGNTIRVAMRNPKDGVAIAAIRGAVGLEPEVWVASERRLQAALSRCYGIEPEVVRGLSVGRPSTPAVGPTAGTAEAEPGDPDPDLYHTVPTPEPR